MRLTTVLFGPASFEAPVPDPTPAESPQTAGEPRTEGGKVHGARGGRPSGSNRSAERMSSEMPPISVGSEPGSGINKEKRQRDLTVRDYCSRFFFLT